MSPKIICLALAIIIIVGLALAAARGHKMPIGVCLTLIIVGALVVLAPTVFSFLLRLFEESKQTMACWEALWCLSGLWVRFFPAVQSPCRQNELVIALPANQSPPTAVGAVRSAIVVQGASRR
jgi:hypothetical protein